MMAEFKKMTTINVKQLAYDFAKHDQLLCAAVSGSKLFKNEYFLR